MDGKSGRSPASGFTLIELLIVIVIIGVLSGVLISVINPAAQQNRAKDATVKSTLNKLALNTSGFISTYGRAPDGVEFLIGINGISKQGAYCTTTKQGSCLFSISAIDLPDSTDGATAACSGNNWNGASNSNCYFFYCAGNGNDASAICTADVTAGELYYRIFARSWGSPNLFMYRSADSKIYTCIAAGTSCVAK